MVTPWLPWSANVVALAALALVWTSYLFARHQRWSSAALAVAAAALVVRAYAAADFALHPWDERYHALVAKNLIDQPLVPTLYADPALPYDYRDWTCNHVWLHKPPLTLWMQAASMRMFGVAELPMRLPSMLFATAGVLVTFAIGRVLFCPAVGLVGGAFHAFNGFLVDLASGRRPSDHVDTLLVLLVEAGILAAVVAERRWPRFAGVALGVACGLAYLTKSLPGLLLLPIWVGIRLQYSPPAALLRDLGVALSVALLIASPWTVYSATAFPREWRHESAYAWRHVTEVLEDQGGPPWQYVADVPRYFGELVYVPIALAIGSVFRGTAAPARRAMLSWIAVPYLLFSMMATKMPAYVMLAAPALFLVQAELWLWLQTWRAAARRSWEKALLTAAVVMFALSPARQLLSPTGPLEKRERDPPWASDLRHLNEVIGGGKAVVFNVPAPIEAMFYTPYVVYAHVPTGEQVATLQARGYRVYVYDRDTYGRAPSVRRVDSVADRAR